jgi:hypothetical protein
MSPTVIAALIAAAAGLVTALLGLSNRARIGETRTLVVEVHSLVNSQHDEILTLLASANAEIADLKQTRDDLAAGSATPVP